MFQKIPSSESNSRGKVSPKMINEVIPVILDYCLTHSSDKIKAQRDFIGVYGHINRVDSALSVGLDGGLFMCLSRVAELFKSPRIREGRFEEII